MMSIRWANKTPMLVYPFQQEFGFHPQTKVPFGSCKIQVGEWNSRLVERTGLPPGSWLTHWVANNSSRKDPITTRALLEPHLALILSSALSIKGPGGVPSTAVPRYRHADFCPGSRPWNVHPLWPQTGTPWRNWVRQLPMNESLWIPPPSTPSAWHISHTPHPILWLISCVHSLWWQE